MRDDEPSVEGRGGRTWLWGTDVEDEPDQRGATESTRPTPTALRSAVAGYLAALHAAYLDHVRGLPPVARARLPLLAASRFFVAAVASGGLQLVATEDPIQPPDRPDSAADGSVGPLRWTVCFYDPSVLPGLSAAEGPEELRRVLGVGSVLYHLSLEPPVRLDPHHALHAGIGLANAHARALDAAAEPHGTRAAQLEATTAPAKKQENRPDKPAGHRGEEAERDYTLVSVHNAARLLCAFSVRDTEYGVGELARKLSLAKSTVHRLLTTLTEEELLERNPRTGRYRLGLKMWELGTLAAEHLSLHEAAAPYLDDLRNRTLETVHIAVLDGTEVVYVERRESPQTLRLFGRIGHRNSAHCTSTGKVLLAFLPASELDGLLATMTLDAKTPYTITDPKRLRAELETVRARGYAVNVNESEVGIASVAAPLLDRTGAVVAAISTAGPLTRFEGPAMRRFAELTVDAARRISERLGYRLRHHPPSGGR